MEEKAITDRLDSLERKMNGQLTDDLFTRVEVEYMIETVADEIHSEFDVDSLSNVEFGINGNEVYIEDATYRNGWNGHDTEGILDGCLKNRGE